MNLLDSLIENNSIVAQTKASNWQQAIELSCKPLIKSQAISQIYVDNILKNTKNNGPYYIIADGLAMPHAQAGQGVNKDCFSLITLQKPVKFLDDPREVQVLIALAATSNDIHTTRALPQIVALFENPQIINKIAKAQNKKEIIDIIKSVDINKYLK